MKLPVRRPLLASSFSVCTLILMSIAEFASGQNAGDANAIKTSLGAGGIGRYERGQWSAVTVNAYNGTSEEAEANISVFLEGDSRTQFTRRIWLPPNSIRKTWLPILPPRDIPSEQKVLHASTLNVVSSSNGDILSRKEGEQLVPEYYLLLDPPELHCGIISSRAVPGQRDMISPREDEAYQTAVEVRMLHDGDRKIINFSDYFIAPYPEAYDALDQLIICSDQVASDSGGLAAMRNWIARGGRAWIMLDLLEMETIRTLLGNATPCEIVDRVELTNFTFETPGLGAIGSNPTEKWLAEEPVEFVRVLTDSVEVHSTIDGWPAAFSVPFGNGQVLITTLAARGWRYQFDPFAEQSERDRRKSGPTDALRYLATRFNRQMSNDDLVLGDQLKPMLSEQLGYRVPSRSIAAAVLGLNCGVIVVAGIWLARREQLEYVAWVVLAATSLSALVLVSIGSANTSSIPATSSVLRLANVSSETNEIHADTLVAFYSPDTVELPLRVDLSGVVTPDMQDLVGVAKRAVWNDDGQASWEQVDVASGSVRFARAKESVVLEHSLRARATFGPNGLEGRITGLGQLGTPSDAIIASPPAPHSSVTINAQGTFQAGPDDLLSATEFLGGAMLSDEQQRRQTIYRRILAPQQGKLYPQRPSLLVWGDVFDLGLSSPEPFQQTGATLYTIPLDIGRTLPKHRFLVPPTFIRMANTTAKQGASAAYNPRTGEWMEDATHETRSFFQFLLPREVVPCEVQSVEITLKIHAPSRTVDLLGSRNNEQVVVETLESPSGVLTFTIDDPELLQVDAAGGLQFGVAVSSTESQRAEASRPKSQPPSDGSGKTDDSFEFSTWQIDYLHLQAVGETL